MGSNYNETTRRKLYKDFIRTHQPNEEFRLFYGTMSDDIFAVFTKIDYDYTKKQKNLYKKIGAKFKGESVTPANFFQKHYDKVVEFCAGSKKEAELLYQFFDKLNQFSYPVEWDKRTVRTKSYTHSYDFIMNTLFISYLLQMYDCTIDNYLLNEMREELLDYKKDFGLPCSGLENIIAAHLDAGDEDLKSALTQIITGETSTSFLNEDIIRGIFKSDDRQLHKLLGQMLVAARLQEGLRQAICENMDCGTITAFRVLFDVIEENNLLRYSAVRRAVATWIGILDPDSLTRSSDKTFHLMKTVVTDKEAAYPLIDSEDAISIMVGLWGLGFYEENDAIKAMEKIIAHGSQQQKCVVAFYNRCLENPKVQQRIANKLVETPDFNLKIAAGVLDTYLSDYYEDFYEDFYELSHSNKKTSISPSRLKLFFGDIETAKRHKNILLHLLETMKKKKYDFNPYLFPWHSVSISRSDILIRLCIIANGLRDEEMIEKLAGRINELDSGDNSRVIGVHLLFSGELSKKQREYLIDTLGDRESYTRKAAFDIADDMVFTEEELDRLCKLFRFKADDLRQNLLTIIKKQSDEKIGSCLTILLTSKKEEICLAGLDLLRWLIENKTKFKKNTSESITTIIENGKKLARAIKSPTKREEILLKELFPFEFKQQEEISESELYTKGDDINLAPLTCDEGDYPLFSITEARLQTLYEKLDHLIDQYKNYEIITQYGTTVLLGNQTILPQIKESSNIEEKYPLMPVWKGFYESKIQNPDDLMAMLLALSSTHVSADYEADAISTKSYSIYIKKLALNLFGNAVVKFDPTSYRYGKKEKFTSDWFIKGGDLFFDIIQKLVSLYCDIDYCHTLGKKVISYLIFHVRDDKKIVNIGCHRFADCDIFVSPLDSAIFRLALRNFMDRWNSKEQFYERFRILFAMREQFIRVPAQFIKDTRKNTKQEILVNEDFDLKAMDYAVAAYYGIISESQLYYCIFETGNLREKLENLFFIYRADKSFYAKRTLEKYGVLEEEALKQFIYRIADTVADKIVAVECKRGDSLTPYSESVTEIEFFCGINHLVNLLTALEGDKFTRIDSLYHNETGNRKDNLCHLIHVCHPSPKDTVEDFKKAIEKSSIGEKRLIELAMYAPQWIDLIEQYLHFTGLKIGAYYFMAHMSNSYNEEEEKFSVIARFTPLEKEELFNGAFDINWFFEAYHTLGEKRFQMLYDAAKYSSNGSRHTRARKYADAALGKIKIDELEHTITEKRNKDLLMSYPLLPLKNKTGINNGIDARNTDILHRYQFIQKFRKDSAQFGAQRRASEGLACDMALRNLATLAGFQDVTRLTLAMELALSNSLKHYFEWKTIENEKAVKVKIQTSNAGKPSIVVKKGEKMLSSIPTTLKRHPYIAKLKAANKKFCEQYSRTVKMFELSMEESEQYSVQEIINLRSNSVIAPIVENLVYIHDTYNIHEDNNISICGTIRLDGGLGLVDETGQIKELTATDMLRIAHPFDLYKCGNLAAWQKLFFNRQQKQEITQPFRQVFRELYIKLEEELKQNHSHMFAGYQIWPAKTAAALKTRRWIADYESGLEKIFYKNNITVTLYALADWFSPSDIEPPTLEYVEFSDRKTFKQLTIEEVPDIVYSEAMRDVDLAVSISCAGGVDPIASHSTIEMRKVIAQYHIKLFALENVTIEGTHAFIRGSLGEYTIHLGSGVIHMQGIHQIHVLPVHSQHRGKIFLPFLDEDPKTAEIISKILLFAKDERIKDPYILRQMY